jgi:hypothetical protein
MIRSIFTTFFIVSVFTLIFNAVVSVVFAAETLTIATDGKTNYVIVLPAEATPLKQTAAKELKQHLDAVTGADFAIVKESEIDAAKPQIVVGNSKRAKEFLPELDVAKIPYDGIVIKSIGKISFCSDIRNAELFTPLIHCLKMLLEFDGGLQPNHLFWFAPPNRPEEVDSVYIDRIVVVRE